MSMGSIGIMNPVFDTVDAASGNIINLHDANDNTKKGEF